MHNQEDKTLYLLSFDVDGTVAAPNRLIEGVYQEFLQRLQQLPGVEVVLNSGKPVPYLENNALTFGGRYVIACNGAACQLLGGETAVFGGAKEDLEKLRHLLGLEAHYEGVQHVTIAGEPYEMAIEEDKRDIVLTLFTEPEWVSHRWQFKGGIDRTSVYTHLKELIVEHNLNLHVLEPHGDGAVDIVRLHEGKPIDKSTLPSMVKQIWPDTDVTLAMFGDGSNDVPAMIADGVIGVTFAECNEEKVKQPVLAHGGLVTTRAAWIKQSDGTHIPGGGPIEGIQTLASQGFFGDLKEQVKLLCHAYLKQFELA